MSKQTKDKLFSLICSLTKAEKRSFRLYVKNTIKANSLYVSLFNHLEKAKSYDDSQILKAVPQLKKSQVSNLKAQLFKHILTCLRQLERTRATEIEIREQIDFAKILYDKGMYKSCLEILEKAKRQAININFETLVLSILYFEKRIESQHITGSMSEKAYELSWQSNETLHEIKLTNQLSNLSLLLYGRYLKNGFVKNEDDYMHLQNFFESNLPDLGAQEMKFFQRLYLFQSYCWYHYMSQDFPQYYKYAQRWVDLFETTEKEIERHTTIYMKGVHNLLTALFITDKADKFNISFSKYENFDIYKKSNPTINEISNYHVFYYTHYLNKIIVNASYGDNRENLLELEEHLSKNSFNWDTNRILIFRYKMACIYFGDNNLDDAIRCLNEITFKSIPSLRQDLQSFARILNLIAHFDLGNEELVNYKLKSLYRFLSKMHDLEKVQKAIITFLRRTPNMVAKEMKEEFKVLRDKLILIRNEKYEKRPFLYLEIIAWLDAKIKGCSIAEIIKANKGMSIDKS